MQPIREIQAEAIKQTVAQLCMDVNYFIASDIEQAFIEARKVETPKGKEIISILLDNAATAREKKIPICQDTGMAVVFIEIGQDVHVTGGAIEDAVNEGVKKGYGEGYLRKSVVADPVHRSNTGDNTPAVLYYDIVPGDRLSITVAPKGFGSENMSGVKMLTPSAGIDGIKDFVVQTVRNAGPNPCPPIIVGVGVGGTMDKAALLSKQALLKKVGKRNPDPFWAGIELELLQSINDMNIGPAGLGGKTTALDVHVHAYPTHIAGLPVAVNIGCHVTRHATVVL